LTLKPARFGDSLSFFATKPDCLSRRSTLQTAQSPVWGQSLFVSRAAGRADCVTVCDAGAGLTVAGFSSDLPHATAQTTNAEARTSFPRLPIDMGY